VELLLKVHLKSTSDPAAPMVQDFLLPGATDATRALDYRKFGKAAFWVVKLKISDEELEQILEHHARIGCLDFNALPVAPAVADWAGFEALVNLIRARDLLGFGTGNLFAVLKNAREDNPSKKQWMDTLVRVSAWDAATLAALVGADTVANNGGILKANFPADFRNGDLLLHIKKSLDILYTIGVSAETMRSIVLAEVTSDTAKAVKQAARSKYDDAHWQKIAKPLRDALREQQRSALVAYTVHRSDQWKNAEELYEYLLIDVEMKPVAVTSRLKQAICSVQLFVDRALMNLEHSSTDGAPILLDPEQAEEWKTWRKIYRVWEANRKIFLYPENWIEPELRDDQTPFFREAMSQLLQNELTPEAVEDAFRGYLEKLDEVAHLETVGLVRQEEPGEDGRQAIDILHVFGRPYTQPHKYFHRSYEQGEWSPWLKIEADIDSNHLVPVIFNRQLCLFWLFFTQEAMEGEQIDPTKKLPKTRLYWKIQIAWSEYRKNTWAGKKLSKAYVQSADTDDKAVLENLRKGLFLRHYQEGDRLFVNLSPAKGDSFEPYFKIKGKSRPVCHASFIFENTASEPVIALDLLPGRYQYSLLPANGKTILEDQLIQGSSAADELALQYETVSIGGIVRIDSQELVFNKIPTPHFSLSVEVGAVQPFERPFVYQDSKHSFLVLIRRYAMLFWHFIFHLSPQQSWKIIIF